MSGNIVDLLECRNALLTSVFKPAEAYAREVIVRDTEGGAPQFVTFRHIETGETLSAFCENGTWVLANEDFHVLVSSRTPDAIHNYLVSVRTG